MEMKKARERLKSLLVLYTENVTGDACVGDEIMFLYPEVNAETSFRVMEGTILRDEYRGKNYRHVFLIASKNGEPVEYLASDVYKYGTYSKRREKRQRNLFLLEKHLRAQRREVARLVTRNI